MSKSSLRDDLEQMADHDLARFIIGLAGDMTILARCYYNEDMHDADGARLRDINERMHHVLGALHHLVNESEPETALNIVVSCWPAEDDPLSGPLQRCFDRSLRLARPTQASAAVRSPTVSRSSPEAA